jgi:hypothetical protein
MRYAVMVVKNEKHAPPPTWKLAGPVATREEIPPVERKKKKERKSFACWLLVAGCYYSTVQHCTVEKKGPTMLR